MAINRREFLTGAAAVTATGIAAGALLAPNARAGGPPPGVRIKAVAFDAFPIFDRRPAFALAERQLPGRGEALGNEWRVRQFEYTWLRAAAGRYANFWQVTQDALVFAANRLKLELSAGHRDALMNAYLELKAWPEAPQALAALKKFGLRLAFLSNFTPGMLDACVKVNRLGLPPEQLGEVPDGSGADLTALTRFLGL